MFNERNGPLLEALGASHSARIASSRVTCFCEYHRKAAQARGIHFDRAREGYNYARDAIRDRAGRVKGQAQEFSE